MNALADLAAMFKISPLYILSPALGRRTPVSLLPGRNYLAELVELAGL